MNTPADVVNAAFEAMNLEDWKALSDLCDPVSLRLFKKEILEQATNTFRLLSVDMADFVDDEDSDDGPCKYAGIVDPGECLSAELCNVSTVEDLQAMDPAKVFARWVQGKTRKHYRHFRDEADKWQSDRAPKLSHSFSFVVLGSVIDTDGIAHVIYRNDRDVPRAPVNAAKDENDSDPQDENELSRILCVRACVAEAVCRQQVDGSWRLIASQSLYLVPTLQVADLG
jgi:hypothetical protein